MTSKLPLLLIITLSFIYFSHSQESQENLTIGEYTTKSGIRQVPLNPRVPKTYDIDLGQNYTEQWAPILTDFKNNLLAFIDGMANSDGGSMGLLGNGKIPSWALDLLNYTILASYNQNWADELQAIAGLLELPFNQVAFLNFMYDLTAECTSLVVQDDDDNVFQARNLDFPYAPFLANMTYHGRYFRDGELVYEAIGLAGYTGLLTGFKNNSFSLSINQYSLADNTTTMWQSVEILALDVAQIARGYLSPPLIARQAFENLTNYDELVEFLTSTNIVSNTYYIIAGTEPGQGEVIARLRNSVENSTVLSTDEDRWFVVQTNYPGDEADPLWDNRLTAAVNFLNDVGRDEITYETLRDVMMTPPVLNNYTIHTTIMQPSTGYFNTTIWW